MNPDTLTALNESIAHWKWMRENPFSDEQQPYSWNCALCQRFNFPDADDNSVCEREDGEFCPVFAKTGQRGCENSPYHNAAQAWRCARMHGFPGFRLTDRVMADWHTACDKEIAFLESLLPTSQ